MEGQSLKLATTDKSFKELCWTGRGERSASWDKSEVKRELVFLKDGMMGKSSRVIKAVMSESY
jgi:hypothetical protein